jgi:acyl-CoA thioester hydrolase
MGQSRIFEHSFRVAREDLDRMGHVNNVVFLRYAQDAAVAHWQAAAPDVHRQSLGWVARRHEIDYLKPAYLDDRLVARTWVGEATGATYVRHVEIARDGVEIVARVRTVWVAVDAVTGRPRRVPADLRLFFEDPVDPDQPGSSR